MQPYPTVFLEYTTEEPCSLLWFFLYITYIIYTKWRTVDSRNLCIWLWHINSALENAQKNTYTLEASESLKMYIYLSYVSDNLNMFDTQSLIVLNTIKLWGHFVKKFFQYVFSFRINVCTISTFRNHISSKKYSWPA